jgi:hypothetical protein
MILIFLFLGRRSRLHSLIREYLLSSAAVTHIYYHSKLRKSSVFVFYALSVLIRKNPILKNIDEIEFLLMWDGACFTGFV